jgi:vitamin B12 transporter
MSFYFVRARRAALSLAALAACSSFAQNTPALETVVVTANLVETPLSEVLTAIDVITREDIERSPMRSLADLLQGTAGFEFGRNGGPGTVTSFFLRGHNSANLVVLVDGVRTGTDGIGSLLALDIPLAEVERVEVVRGDASALYGNAANGGVIHIVTRKGGSGLSAQLSVGERGTHGVQVGYGRRFADTEYAINAVQERSARLSSMNVDQRPQANPDADQTNGRGISFRWAHRVDSDSRLSITVARNEADVAYDEAQQYDDNFNPIGSPEDVFELQRISQRIGLQLETKPNTHWRTELALTQADQSMEDRRNGALRTSAYNFGKARSGLSSLRWFNTYSVDKDTLVLFGAESSREKFRTDSVVSGFRTIRENEAVFGGLIHSVGALTVQANLRHDRLNSRDEISGETVNWSKDAALFGLGWQLAPAWKATASVSKGFRVPTVGEQAYASSQLSNESFLNQEFGITYETRKSRVKAVLFRSNMDNMITADLVNAKARNQGVELSGTTNLGSGTRLHLTWVTQDPVNLDKGVQLARRAKNVGSVSVAHDIGAWELGAKVHHQGQRRDSDFSNIMLPAFNKLDVSASYRLNRDLRLQFTLENASDKFYQLAYGYNTPRRGVLLTLNYQAR